MRLKRLDGKGGCAVEVTPSVIGGVWKPVTLFHPLPGEKRSVELTRLIPGITQRMLTLQLRGLEAGGVIVRHMYPQVPPKIEYALVPLGEPLTLVLISLREWDESYRANEMSHEPAAPLQCTCAKVMAT